LEVVMRLVTAAGAIATVGCVAVAGVVLAQKSSLWVSAPAPAAAAADTTRAPVSAVNEVEPAPATDALAEPMPAVAPAPAAAATPAALVIAQAPRAAAEKPPAAAAPVVAAPAPAAPPPPAPAAASSCPGNPNALGIARSVEIDTTAGPGFGAPQFTAYDFLAEGEVVLTFDDGPWPKTTQMVLAALAAHCTKAIFFPIGLHATYEPGILKQVVAAGHVVGSHTWCHQNLAKTSGTCKIRGKVEKVEYDPKDEIEKGISAVRWALGAPGAPYFRFPQLKLPPDMIAYLQQRHIAMFSADVDSFDFKMRKPEQVRKSVMDKLKKHGKGIVLMHDFQHATAEAAMALLDDLKVGGYKVVFMKPKAPVETIPSYDEWVAKFVGPAGTAAAPASSVIRPID
jgi:peptidoglycan-N-acetylglucosamine deacetylase